VSNLRITDSDTSLVGTDDNQYIYYLGHPTEGLAQVGAIDANYAAKTVIKTREFLTYNVNMVVLQYQPPTGPLQTLGLTAADVTRMVTEASRIWEQVGVRFNLSSITTVTVTSLSQWDLPDDNTSTLTAVTNTSRANGLDIFLVNSITGGSEPLNGSTAYENYGTVGNHETGSLIARRAPFNSDPRPVSVLARTMAHEIAHLIFNVGDGAHDSDNWNLFKDGNKGDYSNADLRSNAGLTGLGNLISIAPESYNIDETW